MSFLNRTGGQTSTVAAVSSPLTLATLTVNQVLRGVLSIDTAAGVAITTATAADILAEFPGAPSTGTIGTMIVLANGANNVTITAGAGVTLAATSTLVLANTSGRYRVVKTSSTAVSLLRA